MHFRSDILGEMSIDASSVRVVINEQDGGERERARAEAEIERRGQPVPFQGGRPAPDDTPPPVEETPAEVADTSTESEDVIEVTQEQADAAAAKSVAEEAAVLETDPLITAEREVIEFITNIIPDPLLRFIDRWETKLDLGLSLQDGETDKTNYSFLFQTERDFDNHDVRLNARYDYSESDDGVTRRKTTDRYSFGARWQWDFADSWFFQSTSNFRRDEVKEIDSQFQQSFGVGWRFLNTQRFRASLTPAFSARYRVLADQDPVWEPLATVFQDFVFLISERFTFREEFQYSLNPDDTEDYTFEFDSRFEARLTTNVSANVRYELDYDNNLAPEIEKLTRRFVLGLGLAF